MAAIKEEIAGRKEYFKRLGVSPSTIYFGGGTPSVLSVDAVKEIFDAIIQATQNDLLVMGFEETLHNPYYILEECVYEKDNVSEFIAKLKFFIGNINYLTELLVKQRDIAQQSINRLICRLDERR